MMCVEYCITSIFPFNLLRIWVLALVPRSYDDELFAIDCFAKLIQAVAVVISNHLVNGVTTRICHIHG